MVGTGHGFTVTNDHEFAVAITGDFTVGWCYFRVASDRVVLFSSCLLSGGTIFELGLVGWRYFRVGFRVVLFSSWVWSGGDIFELTLVETDQVFMVVTSHGLVSLNSGTNKCFSLKKR